MSHPMWVRGLKHFDYQIKVWQIEVAPYVGAWIETRPPPPPGVLDVSRTLCGCVD